MATPLYPTFEKRIADAVDRLLRKQVDPWAFFNAGVPIQLTTFDGGSIRFPTGLEFSGSCRDHFWSRRYIDPFLEDLVVQEIAAAVVRARDRGVDAKQLLPEVEGLLLSSCKKVFNRMAEIDQGLRGKGFPERVQRRSIGDKYNRMKEFIETRIRAEIEMWRPASSNAESATKKERPSVFKLEPSFYGIGINLPEAFRRLKDKFAKKKTKP
jgi:hypothetical protein